MALPADPRRQLLASVLRAALAAVDGRACTARALRADALPAGVAVHVAAIGKAACGMALGAHDALPGRIQRTLIITKDGHAGPEAGQLPGVDIYESSHPMPDARALEAGRQLLTFVEQLPADVMPLFLVSGGASALVEVLRPGATLATLTDLNAAGLASGEDINSLNRRRGELSLIKGGRLAQRLGGRPARALFVSDVPGDDPAVIGSGLMGPACAGPDAVERTVVACIEDAMRAAAAAARGLRVAVAAARFEGEAVRLAVRFAHELALSSAQLHVWGGESVVTLPARPGRGGRNQHLGLAAARLIAGDEDLLLLAAGTDGTDGPTEDAGALVDGNTCGRVSLTGLDVEECLRRADAHTALAAAGDLLHTGPTGTNVGDLVLGLKLPLGEAQQWWAQQGGGRLAPP